MKFVIRRGYDRLRAHWPFLTVAVVGLALLLTNLGTDYLWADEGDTAVLASSVLKFGVPKAWDGATFTDSDLGVRENQQLVMVGSPIHSNTPAVNAPDAGRRDSNFGLATGNPRNAAV